MRSEAVSYISAKNEYGLIIIKIARLKTVLKQEAMKPPETNESQVELLEKNNKCGGKWYNSQFCLFNLV